MRYPIAGSNTTMASNIPVALDATAYADQPISATAMCAGVYAYGSAVTSGRSFFLRGITFQNASGPAAFTLFDGTEGNCATSSARKISLVAASGISTSDKTSTAYTFAAPGIRFNTGCVAMRDSTSQGAATTLWGPGTITAWGYEEA